ncbi:uncharacterized protein [Antedon mediterranea]|uniref:uncharacterized protein n=1 Tax=Antedon mediterranea TaxID=105859 RepID=UPI003AF69FDC
MLSSPRSPNFSSKLASGNYFRTKKTKCISNIKPVGRPSITSKFPYMITVARQFVENNGFEAHRRRQSTTGLCGTGLKELRRHLLQEIEGLRDQHPQFSVDTVHKMFKSPHEGRKTSARYKGNINAKVPPKDNSKMKENPNGHFYSARVKYCLQLSASYPANCCVFSVDNKNKIKIGSDVLAVDRHISIRRFFPCNDKPIYSDHDFPSRAGNLVTPCGYMKLTLPNPPENTSDKHGRKELKVHRSGPVTIVNRGPMTKCTIASHINDLLPLVINEVHNGKTIVSIIADGGGDFNTGHHTNLLYYARLFRKTALDALIVTAYAPGQSAFNMIEHVWGACTAALTSVSIPDKLPGETLCPWQQGLSEDEQQQKECRMYDIAMQTLGNYLSNVEFGGLPINVQYIPSSGQELPYADYNEVYAVMSSNSGKVYRESQLQDEVNFMLKHIDKRIGFISFIKCLDNTCSHCTANPIIANDILRPIIQAGGFPSPMCNEKGDHYLTFNEVIGLPSWDTTDMAMRAPVGRCRFCPSYTFSSNAEVTSHRRKYHPRQDVLKE